MQQTMCLKYLLNADFSARTTLQVLGAQSMHPFVPFNEKLLLLWPHVYAAQERNTHANTCYTYLKDPLCWT